MRKSLIIFLLIGGIVLGLGLFQSLANSGQIKSEVAINSASSAPVIEQSQPSPHKAISNPISFSIPKLNAKAMVEEVGLDKENKMDIPKDENNVAWYKLGVKPGEKGNAVIAGHYDKKTGDPAIFYEINKLQPGDELVVTGDNGKEYKFAVTKVVSYELDKFPLQEVFGESDKARLNLITCEGVYDKSSKLYSHRLVVFSELI